MFEILTAMPMKCCAVPGCHNQIPEHYPDVCGENHTKQEHETWDDPVTKSLKEGWPPKWISERK